MKHVGIEERESCIIGTLDEVHVPPSAPEFPLAYVDFYNKVEGRLNFIVVGWDELIFRNVRSLKEEENATKNI